MSAIILIITIPALVLLCIGIYLLKTMPEVEK